MFCRHVQCFKLKKVIFKTNVTFINFKDVLIHYIENDLLFRLEKQNKVMIQIMSTIIEQSKNF